MSTDTSTTAAPAPTEVQDQDVSVLVHDVIFDAETLTDLASSIAGDVSGYESGYAEFVRKYRIARDAGASESDIRSGIQAQAQKAKKTPFVKSADAMQNIDVLATFDALDGDLPDGWVYRPNSNTGVVGLAEDQESVSSLIRSVRSPADKAELTKEQRKVLTGKGVATSVIESVTTKADAIDALQKARRVIAKTIKENKEEAAGPKTADKYAKALRGPAEHIVVALDAGNVDDIAFVRDALTEVKAYIAAALAHDSLTV